MVVTQRERIIAAMVEDGATVAGVGAVYMALGDEDDASCAATVICFMVFLDVVIQQHKCLDEGVLVVALLEFCIGDELIPEIFPGVLGRFKAPMAIEDPEKHAVTTLDGYLLADMGVLHACTPALHPAGAPAKVVVFARLRVFICDWCVQKTSHFVCGEIKN